jgi:hypothetical protein
MFGLFKKRVTAPTGSDSVLQCLCEVYELLSDQLTVVYRGFPTASPAELRFFAMAIISVFTQSFSRQPPAELHGLINKFTEQCVANMLFHMPKADYSLAHNAFLSRFPVYADMIVNVLNAQTADEMQSSNLSLITVVDTYLGVDRGAFDRAMAGLEVSPILTSVAVSVRDELATPA